MARIEREKRAIDGADTRLWAKSVVYMLIVGGVHYIALPAVILAGERRTTRVAFRGRLARSVGGALVSLGAALAMVSGHFLVTRGRGTPFPLEPTLQLVTAGPYRHVRNPQAIAATLIVTGEALAVRSRRLWVIVPLTLLYLEGLARPLEDRQLRRQFGDHYASYKRTVPRWIPRYDGRDEQSGIGAEPPAPIPG